MRNSVHLVRQWCATLLWSVRNVSIAPTSLELGAISKLCPMLGAGATNIFLVESALATQSNPSFNSKSDYKSTFAEVFYLLASVHFSISDAA